MSSARIAEAHSPGSREVSSASRPVASNRAPDVAYMNAGPGYRLAEQGKLMNLYPYFDKYPDLANRLEGSYFWWDKGKTYGTQSANETMQLYYSKPAFADAGVELPPAVADQAWDWDTFVANAYKLTLDQSGKTPDQDGFDPKKVRQHNLADALAALASSKRVPRAEAPAMGCTIPRLGASN